MAGQKDYPAVLVLHEKDGPLYMHCEGKRAFNHHVVQILRERHRSRAYYETPAQAEAGNLLAMEPGPAKVNAVWKFLQSREKCEYEKIELVRYTLSFKPCI